MLRSRPTFAAVLLLGACFFSPSPALAQITSGPKDDVTALEKKLTEEHAALSTTDCATACRALASIRRAADKICALEPGERCEAGRAKAEDATRRVREACPECAIASGPPKPAPPTEREERAMTKGGAGTADVAAASPPPSESKRGGCAGCTTAPTSPGDLTTAALAMSALAFVLRRRRSIKPSR